jgi:hypothetical protein
MIKKTIIIIMLSIMILFVLVYFATYNLRQDRTNYIEGNIGTYFLDIEGSEIGSTLEDSIFYKDLYLKIKDDFTFAFSKKIRGIRDSVGKWAVEGYSMGVTMELYFNNGQQMQSSNCCTSDNVIHMRLVDSNSTNHQFGVKLQFIKIMK